MSQTSVQDLLDQAIKSFAEAIARRQFARAERFLAVTLLLAGLDPGDPP